MKTVMVTGATGLLGSRICEQLLARGDKVRALARNPDSRDAKSLEAIGVDVRPGDLADMDAVLAATEGADGVIHSAAMIGNEKTTIEDGYNSNLIGTLNVLSAAFLAGGPRVVQVLTTTFFDMFDKTLTEHSSLDLACQARDIYSITKRLGYVEGVARVQDGQDICFMLPGAIYGPSVCMDNALKHPNFNEHVAEAIKGTVPPMIGLPVPYSYVDDCSYVCIAALDKGRSGERYIAHGRKEDVGTIPAICNTACELAGVTHRVEEIPRDKLDDPDVIAIYGETMTGLGKHTYPVPFSDSTFTEERLGYVPTSLKDGLTKTIAWMREHDLIE